MNYLLGCEAHGDEKLERGHNCAPRSLPPTHTDHTPPYSVINASFFEGQPHVHCFCSWPIMACGQTHLHETIANAIDLASRFVGTSQRSGVGVGESFKREDHRILCQSRGLTNRLLFLRALS